MKILNFKFRDQFYKVNEQGHINANGIGKFSPTWVFLGGSKHHWNNHITTTLQEAFKNPKSLENCLGWDKDHGTTRTWGGMYCGRIPRITNVYVTDK
jgi:hypothetical protein